ncbi:MAG: phosphate ABC transporter substrate-binding protein [Candidatus Omnitrophica bacterium]|nr:phosphate ABC transporter substrate-binding protein [Candidatus Omnitrophota bacterium]
MKKFFIFFVVTAIATLVWAGGNSIQIKGSDTMVNLGQAWAEAYMGKHSDALVAVTGGGSGTGIAALLNGTCDITETSRQMEKEEMEQAKTRGIHPQEFIVALDGLAVAVNPANPISHLTIPQIADIFTGKIKNWKELGGKDRPIVVLSREVNSGTHVYFKEHVLHHNDADKSAEFSPAALLMPSSQAIADEIAQNPNAIGYYGMGYVSKTQKAIAVAKDTAGPYYTPTMENVVSKQYYISRPLIFYTNGDPRGVVKDFIDFVFSPQGQEIVKDTDFVPVK